jgi:hypothetical protein
MVHQQCTRGADGLNQPEPRGLLVASSGGHLLELVHLSSGLPELEWHWVSFDTPDARHLLAGRSVVFAHHPTNRNVRNLLRNLVLAWQVARRLRPSIVISTGAGVAVPFLWVARIFGARVIYVESFARTKGLSLTGRLVRPVAHRLFVQWPGARHGAKTEYVGSIFVEGSRPSVALYRPSVSGVVPLAAAASGAKLLNSRTSGFGAYGADTADDVSLGGNTFDGRCQHAQNLTKVRGRVERRHTTLFGQHRSDLDLVVVDGLAEPGEPWDDDRFPAVGQRNHDRADTGVTV